MNMNEKLWKEFLKTPQTKKEKETLGEAVVAIVEETKERLYEGQQGTAFEDVLIAVAKGEKSYNKDEDALKKGKRKNKAGGGEWEKLTLYDLAIETLRMMGYNDDQIKKGVDPGAKPVSKSGISGDPKTDVVIDGKNISLKLPGTIQLGSGEGASTKAIFDLVMDEYIETMMSFQSETRAFVQKSLEPVIEKDVKEFLDSLADVTGKRFYPQQSSSVTRGEWRAKINKQTQGHSGLLKARAEWDWEKGKYPSDGIPKAWKKGPDGNKTEDPKKAVDADGNPLFPTELDYVTAFIARALAKASEEQDKRSWEDIKKVLTDTVNKAIEKVIADDPLFYDLLIDEYLTGRRQFTNEDHIATWYLSPQGFYPIRTREETANLAKEMKDFLKFDARGKGRTFLGKAVAFRIDMDQKKYYEAIAKAALEEEQKKATQDMSEQEEESSMETSLEDKITNDVAKSVLQSIKIS